MPSYTTYYHSWKIEKPKANVIIIHGLGEHIERYDEWATHFNGLGFSVYGFDQGGHGRTGGKLGHIAEYQESYNVLDGLIQTLDKSTPLFLYGHSFGGNMLLNYVLDRNPLITGAIASAPFITPGKPISKGLIFIGKVMSSVYPSLPLDNGLDLNNLSTDSAIIEAYKADPLVHSKISARLAARMLKYADRLVDYKGELSAPLLIMHGEQDILTGPDGSKLFAQNINSPVTIKIWKDEYHEIHNGKSKKEVWAMTSEWMQKLLQ